MNINEILKISLKERLKFELAERIFSDGRLLLYLRLFMIKDYNDKRAKIREKHFELCNKDKEDELRTIFQARKLTGIAVANEYKNILFDIINNLDIENHNPE